MLALKSSSSSCIMYYANYTPWGCADAFIKQLLFPIILLWLETRDPWTFSGIQYCIRRLLLTFICELGNMKAKLVSKRERLINSLLVRNKCFCYSEVWFSDEISGGMQFRKCMPPDSLQKISLRVTNLSAFSVLIKDTGQEKWECHYAWTHTVYETQLYYFMHFFQLLPTAKQKQ